MHTVQARRQLRPQALRELISYSACLYAQHAEAPRWHGLRVLALDSTVLKVPKVAKCAAYFGGMQPANAAFRPLARASALLDVARGTFVDAVLGGYAEDDRSLAVLHLQHIGRDDLRVMGRGYPSRDWLGQLARRETRFCARMPENWTEVKTFLRGAADDAQVNLGTAKAPLMLRRLRFVLSNGTYRVRVTNVLDETLSPQDFAALYRERWRIEEAFKLIKARLQVENWSGVLPHTVEQDLYTTLVRSNFAAVLALAARPEEASLGTPPAQYPRLAREDQPHARLEEPAPRSAPVAAGPESRRYAGTADPAPARTPCSRTYAAGSKHPSQDAGATRRVSSGGQGGLTKWH